MLEKDTSKPVYAHCTCTVRVTCSEIGAASDVSMLTHETAAMQTSIISQAISKVNPLYASVSGYPFENEEIDESFNSSNTQSCDESSDESDEYRSDEETMSIYDEENKSSTKTAFETILAFADNSCLDHSQTTHSSVTVPPEELVEGDSGEPSAEPQEELTQRLNDVDSHVRLKEKKIVKSFCRAD